MATDGWPIKATTLVDSCVLLDVITGDERWAEWSAGQIAAAMDSGRVVINPLIYAEISVGYDTVEELDDLLPASDYEREPLPYTAGFTAGKAFLQLFQVIQACLPLIPFEHALDLLELAHEIGTAEFELLAGTSRTW